MIFMCIVSLMILILTVIIDYDISALFAYQKDTFGKEIYTHTQGLFSKVADKPMKDYCLIDIEFS